MYYVPDGNGGFRPGTREEAMPLWGEQSEKPFLEGGRRVAFTELPDNVFVSTVFLVINHAFGSGPPVLFETMICRNGVWGEQWRYHTLQEAQQGHAEAVAIAESKS